MLGAAHHAAGGKHDVADENNPHCGKRNERKNAKSGENADDGDDKGYDENKLSRRTEIHVWLLQHDSYAGIVSVGPSHTNEQA
ncbi:hypothetical protein MesoLj131a_29120 [Mesorhizobium sp. 131-2-1]|nr:hypothetical protein MesoLj131a_29120 [Mesorhizobium sp. 131-2-1]